MGREPSGASSPWSTLVRSGWATKGTSGGIFTGGGPAGLGAAPAVAGAPGETAAGAAALVSGAPGAELAGWAGAGSLLDLSSLMGAILGCVHAVERAEFFPQ